MKNNLHMKISENRFTSDEIIPLALLLIKLCKYNHFIDTNQIKSKKNYNNLIPESSIDNFFCL